MTRFGGGGLQRWRSSAMAAASAWRGVRMAWRPHGVRMAAAVRCRPHGAVSIDNGGGFIAMMALLGGDRNIFHRNIFSSEIIFSTSYQLAYHGVLVFSGALLCRAVCAAHQHLRGGASGGCAGR